MHILFYPIISYEIEMTNTEVDGFTRKQTIELVYTIFIKSPTYLAEDKWIEYQTILHINCMFPFLRIQPKNTQASEVEGKEDSYLINSLQKQVYE